MTQKTSTIPISSIVLDEDIYPRKNVDHRRVGMFAENIRDGFKFDPIEVQAVLARPGFYRLLDGTHRWSAYKSTGIEEVEVVIKDLDGKDPLLYAATKAIGPKQLTEDETKETARRAYIRNPSLSSAKIGKAIGRSRQTVDVYISDLRAATQMDKDIKIFRMNLLGIPQGRIAKRLGLDQKTIHNHLGKMPVLAKFLNGDVSMGFTVESVAQKHGWTDPMVWSQALKDKDDRERFKALGWGLRTWDNWEWNDCDKRFGDDWPGRIPAQLIGHILFYFSNQNDLVLDPMAGGGVTPDTCLAMNRRCWAFFLLLKQNVKKTTRLAFINVDWRDFQNRTTMEETAGGGIFMDNYLHILNGTGWYHTHVMYAPMSSQRFSAGVVSAMQKKKILGVTGRYVIVLNQQKDSDPLLTD